MMAVYKFRVKFIDIAKVVKSKTRTIVHQKFDIRFLFSVFFFKVV